MHINSSLFSIPPLSSFKERIEIRPLMTNRKILIIAAIVFGCLAVCLAVCYAIKKIIRNFHPITSDLPQTQDQVNILNPISSLAEEEPSSGEEIPLVKSYSLENQEIEELKDTLKEEMISLDIEPASSLSLESVLNSNSDPLDVDKTQNFTPFPFLDLPLEIQFHIYPFLSFTQLTRQRQLSKEIKISIDENYLKSLEVQFELLRELNKVYTSHKSEKIKSKLAGYLDMILSNDKLENFLKTYPLYQSDFCTYLTSDERLSIDWNKKEAQIFQSIINIFFDYATDTQLADFIRNDACAIQKDDLVDDLLSFSSFTEFFFSQLTEERQKRLATLSIEDSLLPAMVRMDAANHFPLLSLLYNTNPNSEWWEKIRYNTSDYSKLINLLMPIWLLDTVALFKLFPEDDSLPTKLKELFDKFQFPGKDGEAVRRFAYYFLISKEPFNSQQMKALAWGLTKSSFHRKGHDFRFVRDVLKINSSLKKKDALLNNDPILVPLLKEFILLSTNPEEGDDYDLTGEYCNLLDLTDEMTTKEQIIACIEGLNSCPEPWKTLCLRLLHVENYKFYKAYNDTLQKMKKEAFSACQLEDKNYQPISNEYFSHAFTMDIKTYLKNLQNLDSEEKLNTLLDFCKSSPYLLKPLAAGLVISQDLTLKPSLDIEIIKRNFTNRGLDFEFFNHPLSVDDFLEQSYNSLR